MQSRAVASGEFEASAWARVRRYRHEAERWTAFRSHDGLEPFYCQPGIEGAHEKAGVEGDVGWFRRNHMVPVSEVDSLDELNVHTDAWDLADDNLPSGLARTL